MSVSEYFESVKANLLTNPLVESFQIVRERIAANDGHIRVRMTLINGNLTEFSEYVQLQAGEIQVITYSYHCTDTFGKLIVRWDNTPHFPDLDNFPHHKHIGCPEAVESAYPMNIFKVLDEITHMLKYLKNET